METYEEYYDPEQIDPFGRAISRFIFLVLAAIAGVILFIVYTVKK